MLPALQARFLFPHLVAKLLRYARDAGIAVQFGEAFRTPEQAAWNAARGVGIPNSLHTEKLAIDLLAFRQDVSDKWHYVFDGRAREYTLLGHFWEGLYSDCAWGGHFGDANHFSLRIDHRK